MWRKFTWQSQASAVVPRCLLLHVCVRCRVHAPSAWLGAIVGARGCLGQLKRKPYVSAWTGLMEVVTGTGMWVQLRCRNRTVVMRGTVGRR